jgi:hypothetical protein
MAEECAIATQGLAKSYIISDSRGAKLIDGLNWG